MKKSKKEKNMIEKKLLYASICTLLGCCGGKQLAVTGKPEAL